jgi:hypothetical protein
MTREQAEELLQQMDELVNFLFAKKLNGAGNCLAGAIECVDDALENHDVWSEQ